jgi:hypothetical protein
VTFLSKAEREYLSDSLAISDGYSRTMRSRLHKKVQLFVSQELPILIEKGYVTEFRNITENCNVLNGSAGSGTFVPFSFSKRRGERNFEPTRPFGHGISNPTPYQARRPPLGMRFSIKHNINVANPLSARRVVWYVCFIAHQLRKYRLQRQPSCHRILA